MADQITQDEDGKTYKNGVLQVSSSPSPDIGGAIRTMVAALAQHFAPQGLVQRRSAVNQAIDQQSAAPGSTDLGQQF